MRNILPTRVAVPSLLVLTLALPTSVLAQRARVAAPRPATPPVHVNVGVRYGYGYGFGIGLGFGFAWYPYSRPWYPYGSPYWYPYSGWWYPPYPYPYGYPPYGPYAWDVLTASVRLQVKPRDAEVYVDGYRAGTVDDFDGVFQRLRMRPGEYELVLYREGLRSVHQHVYLGHGADQRVELTMEALGPGETQEPRPSPRVRERDVETPAEPRERRGPPRDTRTPPPDTRVIAPEVSVDPRGFGSLALTVRPADAEILVDGQPWTVPAGDSRVVIQLPTGRHRIEVRRAGFVSYVQDVGIQSGRTLSLNVSLIRSGG
jgi:hypothetical protein